MSKRRTIIERSAAGAMLLLAGLLAGVQASAEAVWWEGEATEATNFPRSTWFSPQNDAERDKLSGANWLTHIGERAADAEPAFARYRVEVPKAGEYQLWARKFWKHGPFRWRFDDQDWQVCGRDIALADSVELRTHVVANWVELGRVELPAGERVFELELLAKPGEAMTAGFDAFLLTQAPFTPRGKLRPGRRSGLADEGFFGFEPMSDPLSDDALLNLRHLNESAAGISGRVTRSDAGRFVLGDGSAVRFWAVNVSNHNTGQSRESIDLLARKLARLGVNMVRFHSSLIADPSDPRRLDPDQLDNLHYTVHAMAREGIYTKLSFYFPLWLDARRAGLEGFDTIENTRPFALLFFDPAMQRLYHGWVEQLLTTPSRYGEGKPLARDPAVAIVEVINEDSFFFWTFSRANIPAASWQRLEAMFAAHLIERHGSLDAAYAHWGGARHDDDTDQRMTLFEAWHMTGRGLDHARPVQRRRIADQVRFLAELQHAFYADTIAKMRGHGYDGLVSASNWHVTDPALLDAIERYTYTAGDVIDRHGYFGGKHEGEGSSYSVRAGHRFTSRTGLTEPQRLPMTVQRVAGHPHIISELNWPNPNRYRAEATTLTAVYAALQGIDGVFWFAVGSNAMADQSMTKFQVADPAIAATLPATALMYRLGLIAQGSVVVDEVLRLDDLYQLHGSSAATDQALDALRDADVPPGGRHVGRLSAFDELAFFVGPVQRRFGDDPGASSQVELADLIDRQAKRVRSITGELDLDWGAGLLRINAPAAQGAVGRVGEAGPIGLGDVTIQSENAFASLLVVALDGQPLATSRRMLVQAMTETQPFGFATEGDRITDMGGPPLGVRLIKADLTFAADITRVIALDELGYATDRPVTHTARRLTLRPDAVWHIVER